MSDSYNDDPECLDELYTQFYSKNSGGVFAVDECKKPKVKKVSKYIINSCAIDDPNVIYELENATCQICKREPDPYDTLLYINPHNNQISWLCDTCSKPPMSVWRWDRWHRLPAFIRRNATLETEDELLGCIVAHEGYNINQLADMLGWSYGKTRGACKRLESDGQIKIEKTQANNYYESKIYFSIDESSDSYISDYYP